MSQEFGGDIKISDDKNKELFDSIRNEFLEYGVWMNNNEIFSFLSGQLKFKYKNVIEFVSTV